MPGAHPIWDELNLDILRRRVLQIPRQKKGISMVSNRRVWIGFPCRPSCVLYFWKSKTLQNWTTYHGIYQYDGLVVFMGKNIVLQKKLISVISANSGKGGRKPTPPVHHRNMDKWSEFYPPWKLGQASNHDEQQIPIPDYENELVPVGGGCN